MDRRRLVPPAAIVLALILAAPIALARSALPDAPAPAGLGRPIREFSDAIWHLFDRSPLTYARFVDAETSDPGLVVLYFEARSYPYFRAPTELYLVARCQTLASLEPQNMAGGTVVRDRATDAELVAIRSGPRLPCPGGR